MGISKDQDGDRPLGPIEEFEEAVRRVLAVSKEESDKDIKELQAANTRKRIGAKRVRKPRSKPE